MDISNKTAEQSASPPAKNDTLESLCVIIPAHNEEAYIGPCLDALLGQDKSAGPVLVIVAANACTDQTEEIVRGKNALFNAKGWQLMLLSNEAPGKLNAINHAERRTAGTIRIYLDADVICDSELLGQLRKALSVPEPLYATGTLEVTRAKSWVTRAYADLWVCLPFIKSGAVGAGLFAVNHQGRKRWGEFPAIISDDTFVRLHFAEQERVEVPARYHWPMVEGFSNLVRVRGRQNTGVDEVNELFPELKDNDTKPSLSKIEYLRLFISRPVSFAVYITVHFAVRLRSTGNEWTRGR